MALSGTHVICGYADNKNLGYSNQALLVDLVWSETMNSASTTTHEAPAEKRFGGRPVFRIRCSVDSWCAVDSAPNANSSPRFYVAADTDYDIMVSPKDKLAWIAA